MDVDGFYAYLLQCNLYANLVHFKCIFGTTHVFYTFSPQCKFCNFDVLPFKDTVLCIFTAI